VAAAKAKDLASKGLINVNGELIAGRVTRQTLGYVADKYIAAHPGRKHYYLTGLRAMVVPPANVPLEEKPIDEVTTADIKHAVTVWRARKRTLAGAQRGAVAERHLKQATRHLFNWAIEEGHATHTPFRSPQGVSLIHIKVTKGRKRRLQDGEEARILAAADPFIADFFTTMLETGCRPGELRTLQWSEVRADDFVILAAKAKDREERLIPIEPTLRRILDRRRAGPDGADLPDTAFVFGNETGEVFSKERLCAMWRRVCDAAKVRDLHLHDLRAEFASQLAESKVSVEHVRDALGHSNISMTNTYLRSHKKALTQAYKQRTTHRARQAIKRVV
jgi:integrase